MKDHAVFPDEFNSKGNKTKAAQNKRLAQEVGIVVAKDNFERYLDIDNQSFAFRWNTFSSNIVSRATTGMFMAFQYIPKNQEELKRICADAALIEWENNIEQAKELPLKNYTFDEKVYHIESLVTSNVIYKAEREYYKTLPPEKQDSERGNTWKEGFYAHTTKEMFKSLAFEELDLILTKIEANESEKKELIEHITPVINRYF